MAREPLTELAHRALSVVETRSRQQGLDFFQELNRVGLVATEPRIREIQKLALANLFDRLEETQPAQLMNWKPGTADEMYRAVLGWIRAYINRFD